MVLSSQFQALLAPRFQPYLVGLGLGYLLYKTKDQPKLPLNPMALVWIWLIAFLVGCLVIYGLVPYQKDMSLDASLAERAIYGGFHRLAWALALSWVILACIKGLLEAARSTLKIASKVPAVLSTPSSPGQPGFPLPG